MSRPYFCLRSLALLLLLLLPGANAVFAQSVVLGWDHSPDADVAGYRIHYGTASRAYTQQVDVGPLTTHQIHGLDLSRAHYFAVQAYSDKGLNSHLSSEVVQPAAVAPGGATLTALAVSTAFPLLAGQAVTWTAAATSQRGPVEYQFHRYSPSTGWRLARDYSPLASWTWTPGLDDIGVHAVQVWARTVGAATIYEAWRGTSQFEVTGQPVRLTADATFPVPPGQPVRWTASVAGALGPLEYRFLLLDRAKGTWSQLRDYGADPELVWTPAFEGSYNLQVWIRRAGSAMAYQLWRGTDVLTVARTPLSISALTASTGLPAPAGTPIVWQARAKGGAQGPIEFAFYRYSQRSNGWQLVQNYSHSNRYAWTPGWGDEGKYAIQVWARNAGASAAYEAWAGTNTFEIRPAPLVLTTPTIFPAPPGTPVLWTATADPALDLEFSYYVYSESTGTWTNPRSYSGERTFTWAPGEPGRYVLQLWARRVGSSAPYEAWRSSGYLEIKQSTAKVESLQAATPLPAAVGTPITWTAAGSGGSRAPLDYRFYLFTEGRGWTLLRDYAADPSVTWTPGPSDIGNHALQVWVRSAGSSAAYEAWLGTTMFAINP